MVDGCSPLGDLSRSDAAASDGSLGPAWIRTTDLQLHNHGEERLVSDDVPADVRFLGPIFVHRHRLRLHLLQGEEHRWLRDEHLRDVGQRRLSPATHTASRSETSIRISCYNFRLPPLCLLLGSPMPMDPNPSQQHAGPQQLHSELEVRCQRSLGCMGNNQGPKYLGQLLHPYSPWWSSLAMITSNRCIGGDYPMP